MPYLLIRTNAELPDEKRNTLIGAASQLVASELGKPEQYVMVGITPEQTMIFAGSVEPTAFVELKSIGVPQGKLKSLSSSLCSLLESQIGVPSARIYIEFTDAKGAYWGYDGSTFG